jgi:hypothetical protein
MLLEATITPLTSLPTAHPSPEALRMPAVVRRPEPHTSSRFTRIASRGTAKVATDAPRR